MIELVVGALLGAWLAAEWAVSRDVAPWLIGAGALAAYLLSCAWWPYRSCPNCHGVSKAGDGRGNYRLTSCWLCGGRPWRRIGARLIGRGRPD